MTTRSMLTLVDAIAAEATEIGRSASNDALRAQAALVRALVDEVWHRDPSETRVAALHAQLGEELGRLAALVPGGSRGVLPEEEPPIDVLIVDDEPSALRATAFLARELGYGCHTAMDGAAALSEYDSKASIVISDWNMPEMNGLDLCRALKHRDPDVYFILITAFPEQVRMLEEIRGGVDDFLTKPLELEELATRLRAGEQLLRAVRTLRRVKARLQAARMSGGSS